MLRVIIKSILEKDEKDILAAITQLTIDDEDYFLFDRERVIAIIASELKGQ